MGPLQLKFSEEGAKIAIVGRNEVKLKNIAEKCKKYMNETLVIVADVTKDDDAARIINSTLCNFAKLYILVYSAGTGGVGTIFDDGITQKFDQVLSINFRAAVHLTHLAAKHLVQNKINIVYISSVGAYSYTF